MAFVLSQKKEREASEKPSQSKFNYRTYSMLLGLGFRVGATFVFLRISLKEFVLHLFDC